MKGEWRFALVIALCLSTVSCSGDLTGSNPSNPGVASITLAWNAPTINADGSPVTDLAGFKIYYGKSSPLTTGNSTVVTVGDVTEHTISQLEPGLYYFRVAAFDSSGNESGLSEEVSTEITEG